MIMSTINEEGFIKFITDGLTGFENGENFDFMMKLLSCVGEGEAKENLVEEINTERLEKGWGCINY